MMFHNRIIDIVLPEEEGNDFLLSWRFINDLNFSNKSAYGSLF